MSDLNNAPASPSSGQSVPEQATASGESQAYFKYDWEDGEKNEFKSPDELKEFFRGGVLRHKDYTRKTQEVAAERKKIEARNKELEELAKTLNSKQSEIGQYDKFLTSRPDIKERIAREMRQMNPGSLIDQTKGLVDERAKALEEKLNEVEKWKEQQELERKRNELFDHMGKQFPDFKRDEIMQSINKLQEIPDEDNLRSLVELIYYANKGRQTPAQIEKGITENLQKKATLRPLVGSGAKVPPPAKETPKSFKEAAERAKRKLGV